MKDNRTRRALALLLALAMCLCTPIAQAETAQATAESEALPAEQTEVQAEVRIEVETAGNSSVSYPVVSGLADESIQGRLNAAIETGLSLANARLLLERVRAAGGEPEGQATLTMETTVYRVGNVLSVAVSRTGEQADGSIGHSVTALVFDLMTGDPVALDALFADPGAAYAHMEAVLQEELGESMNAYTDNASVLPMPRDNYALDALGLTVYYAPSQYTTVSGRAGAFHFYYYELEPYLSELGQALTAREEDGQDAAAAIREAVAQGAFPNWIEGVRLGEPIGAYLDAYTLAADPDYTLESRVYLFSEPQLRGLSLETWLYAECAEEEAPVTAIRASRIDLFGLRPGVTTLAECEQLLGTPDGRTLRDADDAYNMMLEEGESLFYLSGGYSLEVHADAQGVVSCLILYDDARTA